MIRGADNILVYIEGIYTYTVYMYCIYCIIHCTSIVYIVCIVYIGYIVYTGYTIYIVNIVTIVNIANVVNIANIVNIVYIVYIVYYLYCKYCLYCIYCTHLFFIFFNCLMFSYIRYLSFQPLLRSPDLSDLRSKVFPFLCFHSLHATPESNAAAADDFKNSVRSMNSVVRLLVERNRSRRWFRAASAECWMMNPIAALLESSTGANLDN